VATDATMAASNSMRGSRRRAPRPATAAGAEVWEVGRGEWEGRAGVGEGPLPGPWPAGGAGAQGPGGAGGRGSCSARPRPGGGGGGRWAGGGAVGSGSVGRLKGACVWVGVESHAARADAAGRRAR
jgi:translation initiation factor IF-2